MGSRKKTLVDFDKRKTKKTIVEVDSLDEEEEEKKTNDGAEPYVEE